LSVVVFILIPSPQCVVEVSVANRNEALGGGDFI
jgi:hypothetical protein